MSRTDAARLLKRWDKGQRKSWSGRFFSLAMRPLNYPKLDGGKVIEAHRGPSDFASECGVSEEDWKRHFDPWDRAATRAAGRHRDRAVLIHVLSAFAVLTAVLGAISFLGVGIPWAAAEVIFLFIIVKMVRTDRRDDSSIHQAWLTLRKEAEQFRANALMRTFEANRAVPNSLRRKVLLALLDDQISYQTSAHDRWERLHKGLESASRWTFYVVLVAVTAHLVPVTVESWRFIGGDVPHTVERVAHFFHAPWWLIFTAAGPAFAACLHGIGGKLEVKRLASHAKAMCAKLESHRAEIESLGEDATEAQLKELARKVSTDLISEHTTWYGLLEHGRLEEPA